MKIAFFVDVFPVLSQTFVLNQITGLIDSGHDVQIFAKSNPNEKKVHHNVEKYRLKERLRYTPYIPSNTVVRILKAVWLLFLSIPRSPVKTFRLVAYFISHKKHLSYRWLYPFFLFLGKEFDIIHCHFGPSGNIGAILKQIGFKAKLVTTFHGYDIRLGLEKGGHIYEKLFRLGNLILANSEYTRRILLQLGADPQKVSVHPTAIDLDRFPYRKLSSVTQRPKKTIILTVARLVEEKGLEYAIQAISRLQRKHPEWGLEYHIIGMGYLQGELQKLVRELDLDELVSFLGPMTQEEVVRNLQQAHIFVLPSVSEGLGVSLLEAQAAGLPVVATNAGGIPEAISPDQTDSLVRPADPAALAEKLDHLINHPEIWPEMGRCGREFVEKNYNIRRLNRRLAEIYQELVSGQLLKIETASHKE